MEIINIEKLDGHKVIVMTGRNENVRKVAQYLKTGLFYFPRNEVYFMDYPDAIKEYQEILEYQSEPVVFTTQSKEFLDCLLESDIDFIFATVRQFKNYDEDTYRLRVLTKEEALANRRDFNMELRF